MSLALPPKPMRHIGPPLSDSEDLSLRASAFLRLAAVLIDLVALAIATKLLKVVFGMFTGDVDARLALGLVYHGAIAGFLAILAIDVIPTAYTGQSVGKKLCRIRVVSTDEREQIGLSDALGRNFARNFFAGALGLVLLVLGRGATLFVLFWFGVFLAVIKKRRVLHDICTRTLVVKVEN